MHACTVCIYYSYNVFMYVCCIYFIVVDGKDLIACDANGTVLVLSLCSTLSCVHTHTHTHTGKSDPYCYISVIKAEHIDMIAAAKPNLVNLNQSKGLNLNVCKSQTQDRTLTPVWNESFQL